MNILDIGIIIFVLFGAVLGFKRGFTKEVVEAVGFIVVIVLAYFLKNPLSSIMYNNLPFFKIGIFKGIEILNILLYEMIAFIICIIILSIVLKVLLLATTVFEKILNATIILGIPSKLAGAVVGLIHHYIIAFIILYILSLGMFSFNTIDDSKLRPQIINDTPFLSLLADKSISVVDEIITLKDKYNDKEVSEADFNYQAIDLFLKYDIVDVTTVRKLIDNNKISKFDKYDDLLTSYEGK